LVFGVGAGGRADLVHAASAKIALAPVVEFTEMCSGSSTTTVN